MAPDPLGIANWWYMYTGASMAEMLGIDLYIKHLCPRCLDWGGDVAWYVLNIEAPWYDIGSGEVWTHFVRRQASVYANRPEATS